MYFAIFLFLPLAFPFIRFLHIFVELKTLVVYSIVCRQHRQICSEIYQSVGRVPLKLKRISTEKFISENSNASHWHAKSNIIYDFCFAQQKSNKILHMTWRNNTNIFRFLNFSSLYCATNEIAAIFIFNVFFLLFSFSFYFRIVQLIIYC